MSRVIKFRAWDKSDGVMYETLSFEDMMKMEIMQFTGLLDKNGKEIYEGDILQWPKNLEQYDGQYWQKYKVEIPHIFYTWEHEDSLSCSRVQIIGNIHQNPELL